MEELTALELYNSLLFSFDRLTCGGVSKYFSDADISLEGGTGGNSYIVDEETIEGARYYIQSIIEDNMFELGIYLPDDFETDVTHYELWVDSYKIGDRTPIDKRIRHLTLSLTGNEKVFIRLYNDEAFVDDCVINATAYQGPLDIRGYTITKEEETKQKVIGSYEVNSKETIGIVEVAVTINAEENIHSYSVQNEDGTNLLSKERIAIHEKFKYLDLLTNDMDNLILCCYDEAGNEKYTAYFNSRKYEIYIIEK